MQYLAPWAYRTLFYFLSVHIVNAFGSFWILFLSFTCSSSQLAVICKFNKLTLSWSLMKILNITRLRADPCRTPAGVSLHFDSELFVTDFWVLLSNGFCVYCRVRSSKPYFLSLPVRMSWEKVAESMLRLRCMTEQLLCCPQDLLPFHWRKWDGFDVMLLDKSMLPVTHHLVILQVLKGSLVTCCGQLLWTKAKLCF